MALFGAPVAHEDDAERAARAGLAIQDAVAQLRERDGIDLHVRVGVTTGEALVALGANPQAGEGMATGDVVNTAARLQSAAPVDGVLVDDATHRATDRSIRYAEADAIAAKGKAEPVTVWRALETRSIIPEQTRADDLPLVIRATEASLLTGALDRSRSEPSTQLVTVVGAPGIGKTRLVEALGDYLEDIPELIRWRRDRSLSYGEGVALWALGEMVKAQAGVLESDSAAQDGREARGRRRRGGGRRARPRLGDTAPTPTCRPRCAGGGRRGGDARRGLRRLAPLLRGAGRGRADGARVRGSALGRRRPARLRRPARRARRGGAASDRLHGPAGAARPQAGLGRRQDQRPHDQPRPALARGHGPADRRAARPGAPAGRDPAGAARAGRGQSALRTGVRAHAARPRPARPRGRRLAPGR